MPNLNMSPWMDLYDYMSLSTGEKFSMMQQGLLCFYPNSTRTITPAPARRPGPRRRVAS